MPVTRFNFLTSLSLILLSLAVAPLSYGAQRARKGSAKPKPAPVVAARPTGPLTPLTLEEIPTTPPQVTYSGNQLTIVAHNSTLADILRSVHTQTGAVIDVPSNATERVVANLGPGPARDVLASLLNGSHFDYVMLGSAVIPGAVERIILASKGASPETGRQGNEVQTASAIPQPEPPAAQPAEDPDNAMDDFNAMGEEAEQDQPPDTDEQAQQVVQPNGQPVVKTPEQMIQEMQLRQQFLRQGQGGPLPPGAAPQGFPLPPDQTQPQQPQPPQ